MQDALFYKQIENQRVQCHICPHRCLIEPGQNGLCHTRKNEGGRLYARSYGILSAISTDPIEKKPLYHFYPGKDILSIGSYGCNLSCDFCQNCDISQIDENTLSGGSFRDPEDIVSKADQNRSNIGLAYTYNEPSVYYEFMIRCATMVRELKMRNVMVTNGYINPDPLDELLPFMDAFNIDIKSFSNKFYKNRSGASLRPVLETISRVARSESHLELTFLIIPGHNDNDQEWKEMLRWIADHCGRETVLHVSRYYPRYKMYKPPTPLSTIEKFLDMARQQLDYVYPGNTPQLDNHSYCPSCGNLLVERYYYNSSVKGIGSDGLCSRCNKKITGVFVNNNL